MSQTDLAAPTVEDLRETIAGEVITPDDPAYEEARLVWNGRIDRRPALVVRCASTGDVVAALATAREHDLVVSVRCGGHSTPGYSSCDGGIVIDLRGMNGVKVDATTATARVQGGTSWGSLTRPLRSMGWRSPAGASPTPASAGSRWAAAAAGSSAPTGSPARACSRPRW